MTDEPKFEDTGKPTIEQVRAYVARNPGQSVRKYAEDMNRRGWSISPATVARYIKTDGPPKPKTRPFKGNSVASEIARETGTPGPKPTAATPQDAINAVRRAEVALQRLKADAAIGEESLPPLTGQDALAQIEEMVKGKDKLQLKELAEKHLLAAIILCTKQLVDKRHVYMLDPAGVGAFFKAAAQAHEQLHVTNDDLPNNYVPQAAAINGSGNGLNGHGTVIEHDATAIVVAERPVFSSIAEFKKRNGMG